MKQQQLIQAIEDVLTDEFDTEVEITRMRRLSSEFSRFGGVRD